MTLVVMDKGIAARVTKVAIFTVLLFLWGGLPLMAQAPTSQSPLSLQTSPTAQAPKPSPTAAPSSFKEENSPPLTMKIPTPERFTLDNGIVVCFVRDDELPLLRMVLIINGGAKDDEIGKEGTARLLASLLRAGGSAKNAAEQLDERLDLLATTITAVAGEQNITVYLTALQENSAESLDIFADILLNPALPNDKMAVLKGIAQEAIRRLADDPRALAFQHFNRLMHADTNLHRCATERSIQALSRDDLLSMHNKLFTPNKMFIAVSGAWSAEAIRAKLNTLLGGWQKTKDKNDEQKVTPLNIPSKPHGEIYFIVKDSPQSIIIQGWLAPQRANPAAYPTEIINRIMGADGLVSRLFSEVRTNKGYAYATTSFYRQSRDFGVLEAYSSVKAAATVPAFLLMNKIAAEIRQGSFTSAEIDRTKNSLRNRFVFLFDSPFAVAQKFLELEYYKLPRDFYERYLECMEAVSRADMQNAARVIFQEEERLTVIIGPVEQLEKLRAFRPDVKVLEAGNP